jgi:hypothetical protein
MIIHSTKDSSRSEIEWKFKDNERRNWHGVALVEPTLDDKDKFVLTLKLARA